MHRLAKFSALAISALALVAVPVVALALFGSAEEEVGAASTPALFDE